MTFTIREEKAGNLGVIIKTNPEDQSDLKTALTHLASRETKKYVL